MGLRDEAATALKAVEDQRRAARRVLVDAEKQRYADAALSLQVSFTEWCASMTIDEVPALLFDKKNDKYGAGAHSFYRIYFKFESDTLNFDGSFDQRDARLEVQLVPDDGCIRSDPIRSIVDLGHAIRKSHIRIPSHARLPI